MITYFPSIYPDELLYSQLARYYAKSGYLAYTYAAQDLFAEIRVKPDIEFINTLCSDASRLPSSGTGVYSPVLRFQLRNAGRYGLYQ